MADVFSQLERSRVMSRVKNKNTKPEQQVRILLHQMGYRFRLHRRDLPGSPDIVLPRHKKVIFVHGCFWHGHDCPRGKRPTTRTEFWNDKLDRNKKRDEQNCSSLHEFGWDVLIVWSCELRSFEKLNSKLGHFIEGG